MRNNKIRVKQKIMKESKHQIADINFLVSQSVMPSKKYNSQYDSIIIKKLNKAHDRFLIIDKKDIYHFGASLKDLGKKWFAFSKMKTNTQSGENLLNNLL